MIKNTLSFKGTGLKAWSLLMFTKKKKEKKGQIFTSRHVV
jgi:hypothetical protein